MIQKITIGSEGGSVCIQRMQGTVAGQAIGREAACLVEQTNEKAGLVSDKHNPTTRPGAVSPHRPAPKRPASCCSMCVGGGLLCAGISGPLFVLVGPAWTIKTLDVLFLLPSEPGCPKRAVLAHPTDMAMHRYARRHRGTRKQPMVGILLE